MPHSPAATPGTAAANGDVLLRRLRASRRYMVAGLLSSFFGSSIISGVIPGAIAAGALSILLLPALQTVETIEDLMSPAVARVLHGKNPGKVLVGCETFDAVISAIALAIIFGTRANIYAVLIGYVVLVSLVPLVVDVAEELYAGQVAKLNRAEVLRFNTTIYVLIGLVGSLLARPLGSLISGIAISLALLINLLSSLVAVVLRGKAVRALTAAYAGINDKPALASSDAGETSMTRMKLRAILQVRGPGSPIISGLSSLSASVIAGYLSQWAAMSTSQPYRSMAALLFATGVGATLGPYLTRIVCANERFVSGLRLFLTARLAILAAILGAALWTRSHTTVRFVAMLVLTLLFAIFVVASSVVQATSRQIDYSGPLLAQMVGWSHSAAAAGTLVGTWAGLILGVQRSPGFGLVFAVIVTLLALGATRPSAPQSSPAGDSSLAGLV